MLRELHPASMMMSSDRIPYWLKKCIYSSYLKNIVKVEVIRKWSLSEVLRLTSDDESTIIVKISRGPMSGEVDIYKDILIPARINVPSIFDSFRTDDGSIMLMEDLGHRTVERESKPYYFIEAARELARIRLSVSKYIRRDDIKHGAIQRHFVPKEQYLKDISYLLALTDSKLVDSREILRRVPNILDRNLEILYESYPVTIVHNDYHSKNLIIKCKQIIPIDWSIAYLSPHLGDLYCIIQEASDYNVDKTELIDAYSSIMNSEHSGDSDTYHWQIDIGALCWQVRILRWIMEYGVNAISEAAQWIPDFILGIQGSVDKVTLHTKKV